MYTLCKCNFLRLLLEISKEWILIPNLSTRSKQQEDTKQSTNSSISLFKSSCILCHIRHARFFISKARPITAKRGSVFGNYFLPANATVVSVEISTGWEAIPGYYKAINFTIDSSYFFCKMQQQYCASCKK